jgi:phasin family protein
MLQVGTILGRGLQDIGRLMLGLTQDAVEGGVNASTRLMAATSVTEIIDLQSSLARSGFDRLLEDGSRLSGLSVKLTEEALAPIAERVTATVDRFVTAA